MWEKGRLDHSKPEKAEDQRSKLAPNQKEFGLPSGGEQEARDAWMMMGEIT